VFPSHGEIRGGCSRVRENEPNCHLQPWNGHSRRIIATTSFDAGQEADHTQGNAQNGRDACTVVKANAIHLVELFLLAVDLQGLRPQLVVHQEVEEEEEEERSGKMIDFHVYLMTTWWD
jgi:hypothetical protein